MIVLDASAAIEMLLASHRRGEHVLEQIATEHAVQVPELFDVELLHALRGLERAGKIPSARAEAALSDLADLRAIRHGHDLLRARIWALRQSLTAYDATYIALAEALEAPLLTSDRRLARSSGHEAEILLAAP